MILSQSQAQGTQVQQPQGPAQRAEEQEVGKGEGGAGMPQAR